MACACTGPCGCADRFTKLSGRDLARTLAAELIPVADSLRDLRVTFGLRPYQVRIIRTSWSLNERGDGVENIVHLLDILPTPKITDLTALQEIVQPVGLDEVGSIELSEVSGRYTEDQLRGRDMDGTPLAENDQIFYEIEFARYDGLPGERRRFFPRSAPTYQPDRFQWVVRLEVAQESRTRGGDLR